MELTTGQMRNVVGGNLPSKNCLSLGGGVGCNTSAGTNCYSACQTGCDPTFTNIPTLSQDCTQWCDVATENTCWCTTTDYCV